MAGQPISPTTRKSWPRLVALNKERGAEERRGLVRWLRPDYQIPRFAKGADKQAVERGRRAGHRRTCCLPSSKSPRSQSGAVEQTAAVFAALAAANQPLDAEGHWRHKFKRTKTTGKKIADVLASLSRLGYVTQTTARHSRCGGWLSVSETEDRSSGQRMAISAPNAGMLRCSRMIVGGP